MTLKSNASNRRTFVARMGLGAAALAVAHRKASADAADRLVVGVIGPGGMGSNHLRLLAERNDVTVAYVCDPDNERLGAAVKTVEERAKTTPKAVSDMRAVFDDKSVDAVWIATPDHWHAPASILALDAGKHVYVEKPCCHNIREGRLMTEAVKRTGLKLQVGTQSRSTDFVREGIEQVLSGKIGDILVAKAWNSQKRGSIGKTKPSDPPANLDYDLWVGPAPMVPYRSNMLPSIWRWWYDFGCGDIGNDGVHDIDVALWGFGAKTHPTRITCLGGKYYFDDDQQFPDTQYAVFEYPVAGNSDKRRQFIFEQRDWSPYVQEGYENGAAFYGTAGCLIMGHSVGWKLYGERNKLLAEGSGKGDVAAHHQNFIDCVRGKSNQLNADISVGHRAATLVHLANIAARDGQVLEFNPDAETIVQLRGQCPGKPAIPRTLATPKGV
ncbi:MAG: Gfo/Idh/MocA family oxidoreductase [Planctomycetota bacterium]